jgi:Na+-translocating ferredoxin:NAD+ oxidoreductase RnfG subunit
MTVILHILWTLLLAQESDISALQRTETLARSVFPSLTRIEQRTFLQTAADREALRAALGRAPVADTLHILTLYSNHEKNNGTPTPAGYAVMTNVKGKDQPITFCVVLDERLTIRQIEILAYREPYGGEVRNASWLRQFFGKGPDDRLRPGRDIRNITGATISVRSVTLGVQDILAAVRLLGSPHHAEERAR